MQLATLLIPQDHPTIQAGIDAAADGDLVLVAPGTYNEQLTLQNKAITLASEFYTTGDASRIEQTIIDGGNSTVITVLPSVGVGTQIIGFSIRNGGDGINANGMVDILDNHFSDHSDAIDFEGGGGIVRNNVFEDMSDDAVDLDGSTAAVIENNIIRDMGDDGIEIRLHSYSGPTLNVVIRNNLITGSTQDGIQLIDQSGPSDRSFIIERNLIQGSGSAGLGLMDMGDTLEDFRAASLTDPIYLLNNTFVDNPHAVSGGDNMVAVNNLFVNSSTLGLKNVDGNSIASHNLFWNNGVDHSGSNVDAATSVFADPLLTTDYQLPASSPAIDAGTAFFEWNGEVVLDLPPSSYAGAAPDLGKNERTKTLFFAYNTSATLPGGIAVANEDIVSFDGTDFSLVFDGSDLGLDESQLDAIEFLDDDEILLSFTSEQTLPGIAGTVDDSDVVKFTASQLGETTDGTFELFFDGSDVGLETPDEDVDAIELLEDGRVLISTKGSLSVPNVSAGDMDIIALTPTALGDATAGDWSLYFDASDVGLVDTDVDGIDVDLSGAIYLTTGSGFSVPGLTGKDEDVFIFYPTSLGDTTAGTYDTELLFNGSQFGVGQDVKAIDLPNNNANAAVTIEDVTVVEGEGMVFTVTLDAAVPSSFSVTVDFTDVSATGGPAALSSPEDYANDSVTLSFAGVAGELRQFTVATLDDGLIEPSETFEVHLSTTNYRIDSNDTAIGTITDNDGPTRIFRTRISDSLNDAEERVSDGRVTATSGDLDLVFDSGSSQQDHIVGMRFAGVSIPQGATIQNAYIQFQADESSVVATSLLIQGEDVDDAAAFLNVDDNISSRVTTSSSAAWSPPAWNTVGEAGIDQRTSNIATIVQEIVNRPGWSSGNALAITITGTGERVAESFDGKPSAAPLLHIEYDSASPVLVGAGDIAGPHEEDEATAQLLDSIPGTVFTLGDSVYGPGRDGSPQQFNDYYEPTWGRHKDRTMPAAGNHDYQDPGAAGYYDYFGAAAGDPDKGYYSYDLGDWHVIVLNTECDDIGGCDANSPQALWLQADLAANPSDCTLAITHRPRFSSGDHGNEWEAIEFWQILYDAGADLFLSGHDHDYERFAPQDGAGVADPLNGVRQFVAGTGGIFLREFADIQPNSEVRNSDTHGVLKLTLHERSYDWEFIPIAGQTFNDSGSTGCSVASGNQAPTAIAGPDQTITLPAGAVLDGTVWDDGLPNNPGALEVTWNQVSGPGTVSFADASAVDTTATFSAPGNYLLRLIATDNEQTAVDEMIVIVEEPQPLPGVTISGTIDVAEGSLNDSYLVVLDSVPTADVAITVTPDEQTDLGAGAGTSIVVTFTPANALTPQTIDVTAVDDAVAEGLHTSTISHSATSTDSNYSGISIDDVVASVADNDVAAVTIQDVAVTEGEGMLFTVTLDNAVSSAFDVTINFTDLSATGGPEPLTSPGDYVHDAVTLNFAGVAGETQQFTVATLDDAVAEQDESFAVSLTATNGLVDASSTATGTITDNDGQGSIFETRISASLDDAEERSSGGMDLASNDLDMVFDRLGSQQDQLTGMRFTGVTVPQGATIQNAYIQFQVDEASAVATSLTIQGEAIDSALAFSSANSNITSRATTNASVSWSPAAWNTVGEAGPDQQTPNIASIIQEIVNRPGWSSGNALVITVAGTGERTAESFDGNASAAPLLHVEFTSTSPVLVGAGDIAGVAWSEDEATAQLLDNIPGTVFTLGDNAYWNGTAQEFNDYYDPTWGRHKDRTYPVPGNHEYDVPDATGYFGYFGAAAGDSDKGYYSYDRGDWHIIALNSKCNRIGGCDSDSPQALWLQADLAANQSACTLAYFHNARFSSGFHGNGTAMEDFWQILYDAGADVILSGHDHNYERFAPQTPTGVADPANGIRQFVVGTGGTTLRPFETIEPNSEVRNSDTHGVLKLTLHPTSYDWEFVPIAGQTFTDSGTAGCSVPTGNRTPTAIAGSDQTVTLSAGAVLDGTVWDDGLPDPPAVLSTVWSQVSGPGTVTFADASVVDTTAAFSEAGNYVLRLTAHDGAQTAADEVTVIVDDDPAQLLYLSVDSTTTLPGGLVLQNEDIHAFDGTDFSVFFDGSDVGLGSANLDAFAVISADEILLSFRSPETIPGIVGTVEDSDILKFTATQLGETTSGTFELFFRGVDLGLSPGLEDIDAIDLHQDGRLIISTIDAFDVTGVVGADEDLIALTPDSAGDFSAGTWAMYFDGSDVELGREDVSAVALDSNGEILLSLTSGFAVTGIAGQDEDVLAFTPSQLGADTAGVYVSTLLFDGSQFGLSATDVNGMDLPAGTSAAPDALQLTARIAEQPAAIRAGDVGRYDVSGDGQVTTLDALRVINSLSAVNSGFGEGPGDGSDVNDDGRISALDALLVVNYLSQTRAALGQRIVVAANNMSEISAPGLIGVELRQPVPISGKDRQPYVSIPAGDSQTPRTRAIQELTEETYIDDDIDLDEAIVADIMANMPAAGSVLASRL